MNKPLKDYTNKELLKELGKRIFLRRLELEGINFTANGLVKIPCSEPDDHFVDILDNEWNDRSKPDHTGARTGLFYWLVNAERKQEVEDKEANHV